MFFRSSVSGISFQERLGGVDRNMVGGDAYVYQAGPRSFHSYRGIDWVARETLHSLAVPNVSCLCNVIIMYVSW